MATFICAGGDLNPHALRHMALNHACLPIPAPAQKQWYYNLLYVIVKEGVFRVAFLIASREHSNEVKKCV